jgi:hypothetical protein
MTQIHGNTYTVKAELKALGGQWNAASKSWLVPDDKAAAARQIVDQAPGWPGKKPKGKPLPDKKFVELTDENAAEWLMHRNKLAGGGQQVAAAPATPQPKQVTAGEPAIIHSGLSRFYAGAGIAAVDALLMIQSYAKSKGLQLEFGGEDVRCVATALMIEGGKK